MIFSHQRTILFINKEKIRWAQGRVPEGRLLGETQELPWSEENLRLALKNVAESGSKPLRIVIGEEFAYVTHFQKGEGDGQIASEAQALIPEDLQDAWDTREGSAGVLQIMAVQQKLFSVLKKSILEFNLRVEAMETESISLSHVIPREKGQTVIFAKQDEKILLGAVQDDGIVIATRIFLRLPEPEKVQEFLDYVKSQKIDSLDHAYVQTGIGDLVKIFQNSKLTIHENPLDPMIGICHKIDIRGRDAEVLNIFLGEEESADKSRLTFREKALLASFLLVILAGAAVIYYSYKSKSGMVKIKPKIDETQKGGLRWEK